MEDKELKKETSEEEVKETDLPEDAETAEAEAEETEEAENGKEEKKEKKGFFGKKKEDPRDAQIEDLNDKLRRSMAEFDNFRKRTEKEKCMKSEQRV